MKRSIVMLCRIGGLAPLVLTEIELGVLLLLAVAVQIRTHTFHVASLVTLIFLAVVLGFLLSKVFRHSWANVVAAAVSAFWLISGLYVLFDARAHPQKFSGGDGAESVIFLIPLGLIGTVCWLVLFCLKDTYRQGIGSQISQQ
jgi:hypothetical protein